MLVDDTSVVEAPSHTVVFVSTARSYRLKLFLDAAKRLGIRAIAGVDEIADQENDFTWLKIDLQESQRAADTIVEFARKTPVNAVLSVDDSGVVAANTAAERLGLAFNSCKAIFAAENKAQMRTLFAAAHLPSPKFRVYPRTTDAAALGATLTYPVVVKPLCMSASRGVIRANDSASFSAAFTRLRLLLETVEGSPGCDQILVEEYIQGAEIEVEGILSNGQLKVLAVLDKPDPLEGPFFEETILTTPSRLPAATQEAAVECTARAAAALGLRTGPIHAELRLNDAGPWLLEIAPRSIGGHCSKALVFDHGTSLEETILRHALGIDVGNVTQQNVARGVMMIPIPGGGILSNVCGVEAAESIPLIEEVTITIPIGNPVVPLPEGSSYLGFIFAVGNSANAVEDALRTAHAKLRFDINNATARTEIRIF